MSNYGNRAPWSEALGALVNDFKSLPSGQRLIDELEALISVFVAIAAARMCRVDHVGWAAFSGYMVMRSHVRTSLDRGLHRVIGTAVGAAAAWLLITQVGRSTIIVSLSLGCFGFICALLVLRHKRSYAWLFAGITFAMVLTSGAYDPSHVTWFAVSRVLEVFIGTASCVVVSAFSTYFVRRTSTLLGEVLEHPSSGSSSLDVGRSLEIGLAAQAAVTLALVPFLWRWMVSEAAQQATTTIFAVMAVPAGIATIRSGPTSLKLALRFAGCFAGALLATGALFVSHGLPELVTLALCVGILCGRHLENGPHRVAYGGTQLVLAFLTVLVPDHFGVADIHPGFDRLSGIFLGIILLEPVRLLFSMVHRRIASDGQKQDE